MEEEEIDKLHKLYEEALKQDIIKKRIRIACADRRLKKLIEENNYLKLRQKLKK